MMRIHELRLGTRGSQLALWQAQAVADRIGQAGGPPCRIVVIKTSGDRLQSAPLSDVGGKRLFVKEIEDALSKDAIDVAVHSAKDLPVTLPPGLAIAGVLPREDPLDAVVLPQTIRLPASAQSASAGPPAAFGGGGKVDTTIERLSSAVVSGFSRTVRDAADLLAVLGQSPSIGTGSVRRIAQLTRAFPGARFAPIRGNLDTRLRKLDEGAHDALVLAAAGLKRLGFDSRISLTLTPSICVPAPGQGIVAIEIRDDDNKVRQSIEAIDDAAARAALAAERSLVETLGGGCQMPVGALATPVGEDEIELFAVVAALDGSRAIRASGRGSRIDAAALGASVGAQLRAKGADEILATLDQAAGPVKDIQP